MPDPDFDAEIDLSSFMDDPEIKTILKLSGDIAEIARLITKRVDEIMHDRFRQMPLLHTPAKETNT